MTTGLTKWSGVSKWTLNSSFFCVIICFPLLLLFFAQPPCLCTRSCRLCRYCRCRRWDFQFDSYRIEVNWMQTCVFTNLHIVMLKLYKCVHREICLLMYIFSLRLIVFAQYWRRLQAKKVHTSESGSNLSKSVLPHVDNGIYLFNM